MATRRRFLGVGGLTGAGLFLPRGRAFGLPLLPSILDPLYSMPILDPAAVPKFASPMPVVKALGLRKDLTGGGNLDVTMGPAMQDLLGMGVYTPVWGYDIGSGLGVTYPGGTVVSRRGRPITVTWNNGLGYDYRIKRGNAAAGDVIDRTLHWAFSPHLVGGNHYEIGIQGVPAVAHQHGGRTESRFDGLPEQWFTPGGANGHDYDGRVYTYDLDQEAATLWYHDHALGITRLNVYAGLAGFWLLRDDNEQYLIDNGRIPSGDFETEVVIQDRMFWPDGRLAYPDVPWVSVPGFDPWVGGGPSHQPEFFGQVILVNGQAWPFHDVQPRQYRFRLLNGSDSRFYVLDIKADNPLLPSPKFWVIGNDVGLLNAPVPVAKLTIGPGERYDVVVDFSGTLDAAPHAWDGQSLTLRNLARSPFPKGATVNPALDGTVMAFHVSMSTSGGAVAPMTRTTNLRPVSGPLPKPAAGPARKLMLFEATDHFGRLQPLLGTITGANQPDGTPADGTFLWDDPTTEKPALGSTEVWEIHNATVDAHPIHLHLVKFRILNRQPYTASVVQKVNLDHDGNTTLGGALRNVKTSGKAKGPGAYEAGWKDTALMYPGEVTRIAAKFDRSGPYVWHCHILSHEDHEMMRRFEVI